MKIFKIAVAMVLLSVAPTTTSYALPDGAVARLGKGQIQEIAFSPDGTTLAVATSIGIYLYDPFTQIEIDFIETDEWITCVAFSPDGSLLASGSLVSVKLWDTSTYQEVATLREHPWGVLSVAFSPDGKLLASGDWGGIVRLWDISTYQEVATLEGHPYSVWEINSVAFSPDGSLLASGSLASVKLWDTSTYQEVATLERLGEHAWGVLSVAFSPDGKLLAGGSAAGFIGANAIPDGIVRLWQISSHKEIATLTGHSGFVNSVAFSPDGKLLASGGDDDTVKLWDTSTYQEVATLEGHSWKINSVAFSPDGKILASGGKDGTLLFWDTSTYQEIATLRGHSWDVNSVAFSPNGELLASGGDDDTVKLWDTSTYQEVATLEGYSNGIESVAFSPDGKILASGSRDKTVKLWDASTYQEVATLEGYFWEGRFWEVNSVAFSPDGKILASGYDDGVIKFWDPATFKETASIVASFSSISSLMFSPDGKLLAIGCESTKLWDVSTHERAHSVESVFSDYVYSVAFSPDGSLLASGCADWSQETDQKITLHDASTGQKVKTLTGHSGYVYSVAFSPDGSLLANGSQDKTVKLWDTSTYQEVATLEGHFSDVHSVAFSPDGKILASGGEDGTLLFWDMTPYALQRIIISSSTAIFESGDVQQFTVSAYDSTNRAIRTMNADVIWSVDGNIGTIDENGLFTATTVGTGKITATLKVNTTIVAQSGTLTVKAGDIVELTISEAPSQLKTGDEHQFTLAGKDAHDNDVVVQNTDVTWSVVDGVGSISTTGLFMADEGGNSSVKATLEADPSITATTESFTIQTGQAVKPEGKLAMSWSGVKGEYTASAGASPSHFALGQNFPNPFNPETWIPYQLAGGSEVKIWIYGTGGKLIRQLDLGHRSAGFYLNKDKAAYWDGYDDNGDSVASGVYFYQIQAGRFSTMKKLVVLR